MVRIPILSDLHDIAKASRVVRAFSPNLRNTGTIQEQFKDLEFFYRTDWMWYARYSDVMRIIHLTMQTNLFRNGIDTEPIFKCKCTECEKEFDNKIDTCDVCGGITIEPSETEKQLLEEWMEKCNANNQKLIDVGKETERDWENFDDNFALCDYEYSYWTEDMPKLNKKKGDMATMKLKEVLRLDPIWMNLFQDRTFRYGRNKEGIRKYICLFDDHRTKLQNGTHCEICGRETFPVWYEYNGYNDKKLYYAEHEIIHASKYMPSLSRGDPPIRALLMKLKSLIGQDAFILQTYSLMRPPKGIVTFNSSNPAGVEQAVEAAREEHKKNPLEPLMIAFQSENIKNSIEYVDFMKSNQEMQFIEMRNEFRRVCLATYGLTPIFSGDIQSAGGLNNDSRQLQIKDDTIEFGQTTLNNKFFEPFVKKLGVNDWRIIVVPAIEKNELEEVQLDMAKAQHAQQMKDLGFSLSLDPDGEFVFEETENLNNPSSQATPESPLGELNQQINPNSLTGAQSADQLAVNNDVLTIDKESGSIKKTYVKKETYDKVKKFINELEEEIQQSEPIQESGV